ISEVEPNLISAIETLQRTTVRSPATGHVLGLNTLDVGSVIRAAEPVFQIIPTDGLAVRARVAPNEVEELEPGMQAHVRLTAYSVRTTPVIPAKVDRVSADVVQDDRTGIPYYEVRVAIQDTELVKRAGLILTPG